MPTLFRRQAHFIVLPHGGSRSSVSESIARSSSSLKDGRTLSHELVRQAICETDEVTKPENDHHRSACNQLYLNGSSACCERFLARLDILKAIYRDKELNRGKRVKLGQKDYCGLAERPKKCWPLSHVLQRRSSPGWLMCSNLEYDTAATLPKSWTSELKCSRLCTDIFLIEASF